MPRWNMSWCQRLSGRCAPLTPPRV
jgi:hypothetical protein